MKTTKRLLATLLTVIMLFGVVAVVANAASLSTTKSHYGYMLTTDAKISKAVTTVKVYGNYDYINFYINSYHDYVYFFYEIYSDKKMTKLVASDYTYCDSNGTYSWSPMIKLKGVVKTGTFYGVTYAAKIDDYGNVTISEKSLQEFKLSVNRSPKFNQQMVILKSVTNTVNGPTVKWSKLSNDVSKYVVYRRSMSGTKWTKVATVKASVLSYTDKSVKDKNGKYIYTVKAYDKKNTASRYIYNGLPCLFARAPKVSSVATTSDNRIQVKWNNTSSSAYYRVYRSENGGSWQLLNSKFKGTTYYDTTAKIGKNYKYTVKAVIPTANGNAISAYHNVNKTVDFVEQPKLNPVTVVDNGLKITWGKVTGATAYTVYKKTLEAGANWVNLGKVSSSVTEFIDTTANENSAFIYTVRSEGKTCRGSYSSQGVMVVHLETPEIHLHDYIEHNDIMRINIKNVPYASQYIVYYRGPGGEWIELNKFDVDKTYDFTLVQFKPEKYGELEYSVRAIRDDVIYSDYSAPSKINAMPNISIQGIDNITEGNRITWKDIIAADKYEINRAEIVDGVTELKYELIATIDGDKTNTGKMTYIDKTTEYGKKYSYIVKFVIDDVVVTETPAKESVARLDMTNIKNTAKMLAVRGYIGSLEITDDNKDIVKKVYYLNDSGNWKTCGEVDGENGMISAYSYHACDSKQNYKFSVVYVIDGCESPIEENVLETRFPTQFIDVITSPVSNGVKVTFSIDDFPEGSKKARKFKVIYTEPQSGETKQVEFDADNNGVGVTTLKTDVTVPKDIYIDFVVYAYQSDTEAVRYEDKITILGIPELYKTERNSDGTVKVYWKDTSDVSRNFFVYRKAEGETKWKCINESIYVEFTKTFNGVEYCGYTDKTAKSGVEYTYTVRALSDTTDGKVSNSYYDTKGITATAK
ncbi:MAG: hypothetical protein E7557_02240 [Ruminococcaceae bacterium]|nr:hypothetical protein [Oscillospiraceae bacterium]